MSAQLLTLLKFGLLALLYLFFVRVLFSVWAELRPTGKHADASAGVAAPVPSPVAGAPAAVGAPVAEAPAARGFTPRRTEVQVVPPAGPATLAPPGPLEPGGGQSAGVRNGGDPFNPVQGRLLVLEPPGLAGLVYELGEELTVGRAPGCGISLDDTFVSSLHARIYRYEGTYVLEDLGSTNGTFLNGGKVAGPNIMQISDTVRFGSMLLELQ